MKHTPDDDKTTTARAKTTPASRAALAPDVPADRLAPATDGTVAEAFEKVMEQIEAGQVREMKASESAGFVIPDPDNQQDGKRTGYQVFVVAVKFSEQQLLNQPSGGGLVTEI